METPEEVAERLYPYEIGYGVYDRNCEIDFERERFIEGAKWQQQRSYSEEEVENILIEYVKTNPSKPYRVVSWFTQFKRNNK